jgi:ABC-2 type transport system ATP-binding protein
MEEVFRRCVEEERARGRSVLLSSHILGEVEALCDRVTIIRRGRTAETGTLAELRHLTRTSVEAELAAAPVGLEALDGLHGLEIRRAGELTRVRCDVEADRLDALVRVLSAAGIRSLTSRPPTLEELFLRHYQDAEPIAAIPAPAAPSASGAAR